MRVAIVAIAVLAAFPVIASQRKASEMDTALGRIEASKSPAEATEPMRFILAHATEAPAMHLFLAAAVAFNINSVEDAAYLFYVAQMRMRYDFSRYPPKAKGGDSPGVALGAVSQQLGAEINPAIMRKPASFANVVARVQAWAPATSAGYNPGWEYTAANETEAKRQFTENHDAFVKQFGGLSTLLNDPEYFSAFKVLQDFNFAAFDEQQKPARLKEKKAAEARMLAIETKRGIEGLYYRKAK